MYGRTDGRTDELIRVELGNLSVPPGTLAACGLEEHVQITLIFIRLISFMIFTVLLLLMYFY